MKKHSNLLAIAAAVAACGAQAQTVAWTRPYHGELRRADGQSTTTASFSPVGNDASLQLRIMAASGDGVVLAGAASLGDDDADPRAAYAMKIDARDGHPQWHWQPDASTPARGRVDAVAADPGGDVVVVGTTSNDLLSPEAALIAKLDGATGTTVWRDATAEGSAGYDARIDANADVVVTVSDPLGGGALPSTSPQRVSKLNGATGALMWTATLPDASRDMEDLRVVVDSGGDVVAAGHYQIPGAGGTYVYGMQLARLRGSDGAELWRKRTVDDVPWRRVNALATLADGDVLVLRDDATVARYAALDGSIVWTRSLDASMETMLVAGDDRIYAGGPFGALSRGIRTNLLRLDAGDGSVAASAGLPIDSGFVTQLALAPDGYLVAAWQGSDGDRDLGFARVGAVDLTIDGLVAFGADDPSAAQGRAAGLLALADGNVLIASSLDDPLQDGQTFHVTRVTGAFADDIFANGFE